MARDMIQPVGRSPRRPDQRAEGLAQVPGDVRQRGMAAVCAEALPPTFRGSARTWFSLDMDVRDIGAIPGWGDEPIGLSSWDVIHAVLEAGRRGVDALSLRNLTRPALALCAPRHIGS